MMMDNLNKACPIINWTREVEKTTVYQLLWEDSLRFHKHNKGRKIHFKSITQGFEKLKGSLAERRLRFQSQQVALCGSNWFVFIHHYNELFHFLFSSIHCVSLFVRQEWDEVDRCLFWLLPINCTKISIRDPLIKYVCTANNLPISE